MEFLKSAVASAIAKGSSFPYIIGDRLDNGDSIWSLHNATKKEDNAPCSIFTFDVIPNRSRLPLAKNAARKLRTLRHPGVVKVLDTVETEANMYIITEKVAPLSWHVKRRSLNEETIKWGLFTVCSTLKFVNEEAASVHGSVRVSSVYTSESGEWKLGGFEILSSLKEEDAIIYHHGNSVPGSSHYSPPEVTSNGWATIKRNPHSAADSYGFGILIFEVFNGKFTSSDQLTQTKGIASSMFQSYRRLVNTNPKLRLSAAHFLDQGRKSGGFFDTTLIRLTESADSLGLKSETERDDFLGQLDDLSDDFPEDFFKMKILPELLKSVEFGGGGPKVFGAILKIGSKLSDEEFELRVVPVIVRLFSSPDRAMRVSLLDNLPSMIDRIPQKEVNNKIFPMMVTGFTDTAPVVREQTVKAVLTIIGKLSDRTINGELLRYLAKTANDEQPGIRTNTTICLGKIARNLGNSTRAKVLIAAFSRSLRDPFVHARNAALLAWSATIDIFSDDECAIKILPALCLSLVDKEKIVRDQANKSVDIYLHRVRRYAASMPDTVLPQVEIANSTNGAAARMGNQSDTTWAGWAISSFTNKITLARGDMQTAAVSGKGLPEQNESQPGSVPQSGRATPIVRALSEKPAPGRIVELPSSNKNSTSAPVEEVDADDIFDAWGTMDDDGDAFFDAPSASKPILTPSPSNALDDGGQPDFSSWLVAQSQAKAKKPLPKDLSKNSGPTMIARPASAPRARSASNIGPGDGVKKLGSNTTSKATSAVRQVGAKLKEPEVTEDDWGDAWD